MATVFHNERLPLFFCVVVRDFTNCGGYSLLNSEKSVSAARSSWQMVFV